VRPEKPNRSKTSINPNISLSHEPKGRKNTKKMSRRPLKSTIETLLKIE
jgi:hypothetical protein